MDPVSVFGEALASLVLEQLFDLLKTEFLKVLHANKELEQLQLKMLQMKKELSFAEGRATRGEYNLALLRKLNEAMYDAEDLVDICRIKLQKIRNERTVTLPLFSSSPFYFGIPFRYRIGRRVRRINAEIGEILAGISEEQMHPAEISNTNANSAQQQARDSDANANNIQLAEDSTQRTHSILLKSDVVGVDKSTAFLVEELTGVSSCKIQDAVYAIHGMPGIGKTTFAKAVFNHEQVMTYFEIKIWCCVARTYKASNLLITIINDILKTPGMEGKCEQSDRVFKYVELLGDESERQPMLLKLLGELVENRRILLVLDDAWDKKFWEDVSTPLGKAVGGSKVLVTTRNKKVAQKMKAKSFEVDRLSETDGWLLLCKVAFREDEGEREIQKFRDVGMQIVNKCRGVPLSIKAIGGVLIDKRDLLQWGDIFTSNAWNSKWLPAEINPALFLSYLDLKYHQKLCFTFCSMFPEDFKFHQQNLVQLWIAEGFVPAKTEQEMEEVGNEYYKELIMKSLLYELPDYYDGRGCAMHGLMHELARAVMSRGLVSNYTERRHLYAVKQNLREVPQIERENNCLRTLLLSRNPSIDIIPPRLFDEVRRLRVLDLSYTGIKTLPETVGNLVQLRFLNLSFSKLEKLPMSIKFLSCLRTLLLHGCKYLKELPKEVEHLSNLRCLLVGTDKVQLDSLPMGIGRLQNLRILQGFVVNKDGCTLEELGKLTNLTDLTIYKLERVAITSDAQEAESEAQKAKLTDKMMLNYLKLSCLSEPEPSQPNLPDIVRIKEVFEGLKPPSSLQSVHVQGFFGQEFPSWIGGDSLPYVKWLRLEECNVSQKLPPLGQLQNLKILDIKGMSKVEIIPMECLGGANFPMLEELYFVNLCNLKEWKELEKGVFPCLKKLHIIQCPLLASLPKGLCHVTC